jgi:hypothetical protein
MGPIVKSLATALALSVVLFAGCKTQPVFEVVAAPIPVAPGKTASMDDVQKAIVRGGTRAGWQILPEAPGRLTGRYQSGNHTANVAIDHDTKTYNIKMRDTSVRSDGASVHRAYNMWVQNLDRSIRVELASLGGQ